jgi:2,3-bisphosphoglycerate-dependent phosphoglycerate mutase
VTKRFVFCCLLLSVFVAAASAQSTIFIIRHAEKADSSEDSDLSEAGRARAEVLAKMLKDANITAIYVTEFKRTQQTAAALAKALGIPVTTLPAKDNAALLAKLRTLNGNALVIGHGDTIPDLIKALGISEPINIAENDYDNLFEIVLEEKPKLIRLHYQ